MTDLDQPLWAITSYFNSQHFRRRLANYRLFRQHLRLPLLTVELAFDGIFELRENDAHLLIQLPGGDVMWQKERLLNIALKALPRSCRKVAWLDCDIVFGHDDWPERMSRALDDFSLAQAYSRLDYLRRETPLDALRDAGWSELGRTSVAYLVAQGQSPHDKLGEFNAKSPLTCALGMGWGARRELLDEFGFYDACILGGGNKALVCAGYGCFEEMIHHNAMNDRQQQHYLSWAQPFHRAVQSAMTFVDCPVYHLWHGDLADRQYLERHRDMAPFYFDPSLDLALGENGVWRWNSKKPELHQYVRAYFAKRREDG